jgi:hypothetical protein
VVQQQQQRALQSPLLLVAMAWQGYACPQQHVVLLLQQQLGLLSSLA